jgi:hypothetical protein
MLVTAFIYLTTREINMAKRLFCSDIEGDDLLDGITKVWCASFQELTPHMQNKGEVFTETQYETIEEYFTNPDNILVMHNGIGYDKPALEKVMGIKVEAEVIDTLYLSWYLYPKMLRHGLAVWGEEFGIPKPVIDDWENLSLEEYIHRCQEDVHIQTMLWKQIWKHLILLYGNAKDCWHLIRHLNFKAKCAAMQQKARWKLDIPAAEKLQVLFDGKFEQAKIALEARMPKVPVKAKKTRPKKCFKTNGELSAIGQKWNDLVLKQIPDEDYDFGRPVDYDGTIVVVSKYKEPNAGSAGQLKDWLFTMGWVPESFNFVRNKETNETRQIPQIKDPNTELLCASIERLIQYEPALDYLREMSIVKHRGGITRGLLNAIDEDGYVYAAVQGLTNTLRFKHKICVNLPSGRKPYGAEIRGLLKARNKHMELCGSDMSSLEDRTKQHYMWKHDPEYVMQMQEKGFDPHLDMAVSASMMTQQEANWYKANKNENFEAGTTNYIEFDRLSRIRHGGKSTNYSATYGARGPTIARAAGVEEAVGDLLCETYWKRNWSITAIADECIVKNSRGMKWLYNPVGKIWLFLKADKDRFSTLNQGTGTYCFDRWVWHILRRRPQLTAQFHDEVILELKKGNQEAMTKILKDAIADVNEELKLDRDLDCDVDFGANYSEIH